MRKWHSGPGLGPLRAVAATHAVCTLLRMQFTPMNRFRKASAIPFTPSQFRIGEPNAILFSTKSPSALIFKLIILVV